MVDIYKEYATWLLPDHLGPPVSGMSVHGQLNVAKAGHYQVGQSGGACERIIGLTITDLILISPKASGLALTSSDYLKLQSDFTMNSIHDRLLLQAISSTVCVEIARSSV